MLTIKRRYTEVPLFQGGDYDHIEQLALELESTARGAQQTAQRYGDDAADDEAEIRAKAAEYDEAVSAAAARGHVVIVVALPRKDYRALIDKHPPRPDVALDTKWGFNFKTLAEDLVPPSIPLTATVDDPDTGAEVQRAQFDTETERQAFLDELSDGNFSRIYSAAVKVNQGADPDPKVSLASRLGDPTSPASTERPALRD